MSWCGAVIGGIEAVEVQPDKTSASRKGFSRGLLSPAKID